MLHSPKKALYLVLVGALVGFVFASFSTSDFAQHLDRQIHSINCSFLPGIAAKDASSSSGCQVTMMSPYSSVFRDSLWGGIPIALPAMSVFMLLFLLSAEMLLSERYKHRGAAGLLLLVTLVPALTSAVMAYIAFATLGAACKLCIGIYAASALCLVGALGTRSASQRTAIVEGLRPGSGTYLPLIIAGGVLLLVAPILTYVAASPNHDDLIGECGTLPYPGDRYKVMLELEPSPNNKAVTAIEILDPLCPACKGFEERLVTSGLDQRIHRKLALFPLDNSCNWMVKSAIHPGACVVSEALLCAEKRADDVLAWAFENQDNIRRSTAKDPSAALRMVREQFPKIGRCVGSASARSKLNKSLRWAVANRLKVLTPQLYIAGNRLCDEDIDLGLNYALSSILERHARGELQQVDESAMPPLPLLAGTADTDTADTDTADTDTADADTADADTADVDTADIDTADVDTADVDTADTDTADADTASNTDDDALHKALNRAGQAPHEPKVIAPTDDTAGEHP